MGNRFQSDAAGNLQHFIDEELRAIVPVAAIPAYIKASDFDAQLQYQNVQAALETERQALAQKAAEEAAKQNAQLSALVDQLVAKKLAELQAAVKV